MNLVITLSINEGITKVVMTGSFLTAHLNGSLMVDAIASLAGAMRNTMSHSIFEPIHPHHIIPDYAQAHILVQPRSPTPGHSYRRDDILDREPDGDPRSYVLRAHYRYL